MHPKRPGARYSQVMKGRRGHRGFTILEAAISLVVVAAVLAVLLPSLSAARTMARRDQCQSNQRIIGQAWLSHLAVHGAFPAVAGEPSWLYGGVRHSALDNKPFIDHERPLNRHLPLNLADDSACHVFCCPGDTGIGDPRIRAAGTGRRSAYQSFGTSYRANARLLDAALSGLDDEPRGLRVSEVRTQPSATVVMGDAVWFEAMHSTGRDADWHGAHHAGVMLFMDGSVRFMTIDPDSRRTESMFEPVRIPVDSSR
jgi:type II secretory pathway pseudopilin PulG